MMDDCLIMLNNPFVFIGIRYASLKSGSRFLSFLSRIATGGMIFSVALLVVVMSVMNGFDRELRFRILDLVPHISFYLDKSITESQTKNIKKIIAGHPYVIEVEPFMERQVLLKGSFSAEPVLLVGMENYPALSRYVDTADWGAWKNHHQGILLGKDVMSSMKLKKGDRVFAVLSQDGKGSAALHLSSLEVAGSFNTQTELDRAFALVPLDQLRQISGKDKIDGFRVLTKDLFLADKIGNDLLPELPMGVTYQSWSKTHGGLYDAVQMSRSMVNLLMFLIIAIAVFNLVSTLMLVVMEQKQSIAILRVMGASRLNLVKVFLVQGMLIGLTGALIGAAFGVLISILLPSLVTVTEQLFGFHLLSTDIYPVSYLPSDLRMEQVGLIVLVCVLFSLLASLYPAWKGSQTAPARVLRYE
jgi:lipoprotein-releasing system permease protein